MPYCPDADFARKLNKPLIVISYNSDLDFIQNQYDTSNKYEQFTFNPLSNTKEYYTYLKGLNPNFNLVDFGGEPQSAKYYYNIADKFISLFHLQEGKSFPIGYEKSFIVNNSIYLIKELIDLGVDNISFEFTLDNSIIFTSKLLDRTIYCEVYFDTDNGLNEIEIITNIYKDKNQVFTYTSDLQTAIQELNSQKTIFEGSSNSRRDQYLSEASGSFEPVPDYRYLELAAF